jgi:hypothetical protein
MLLPPLVIGSMLCFPICVRTITFSYSNGAAADSGVYEICYVHMDLPSKNGNKNAVFRCNLVIFRFSGLESQYVEEN